MRKIVGYEKFKSRKGTDCCAVSVEKDYKARDGVEQIGIQTENVMVYGSENVGMLQPDCIGKELVGYFGYNNGVCAVQNPSVQ